MTECWSDFCQGIHPGGFDVLLAGWLVISLVENGPSRCSVGAHSDATRTGRRQITEDFWPHSYLSDSRAHQCSAEPRPSGALEIWPTSNSR